MTITMRDRYRGAMLGVHCGDALGAPVEWMRQAAVADYFAKNGGFIFKDYLDPWAIRAGKHPRTIKTGQPTDDSELAAALAESLIAYPEFNPEDVYARLRRFIHDRKSILTDQAFGSGKTLRAALKPSTYAESKALFDAGEMPLIPSNGSLMRCIAVPLAYPHVGRAIDMAQRQSRVTHMHEECQAVCAAYSALIVRMLQGKSVIEAWRSNQTPQMLSGKSSAFMWAFQVDHMCKPDENFDIWRDPPQGPGGAILSLRAALWASKDVENFAEGVIKAISLGGDTDTYGAIAGGILGAHFGIEGIPKDWLDALQGRDKMIELADQLYDIAHS